MINDLQIDPNRCILNGRTSDVQYEYCNSSLAVCSSRFEGFGLAIVEAMACGLPVVSFDCPWGPRSIIKDGEDGVLVENGNVERLAGTMVYLMKNPDVRILMSKTAIINARRYDIEQIAEKWRQLFESL